MAGCVSENEVVDLFEGRLDAAAVDALTKHIDGCAACRKLCADTALALGDGGEDDDPRVATLRRGSTVGRYVILDCVGAGSMGLVYAAYDPDLGRKVALKILRTDAVGGGSGELRGRLLREAQAMAQLSHPNVITVHDVGTFGGQVFVAMEFIEGGTLGAWLRSERRGWREVLDAFVKAGQGLAAAHAAGLVHRDFKPENVLVGSDGRVRVTDFGLARSSGSAHEPAGVEVPSAELLAATMTRTGALVGTPAYMAPEQIRGRDVDARSDLFSFSVALYEALYGERPFEGVDLATIERAALADRVRDPPRKSSVPAWLRRIVVRGLRADPAERWPTMQALLDALRRGPLVTPRRASIAVGVAALLTIGALGAARSAAPAVCTGAEHAWGDVWDAQAKAAARAAFERAGGEAGVRAHAVVDQRMDAYRAAWIGMHTEACEATRKRGEQSEALLDLRMMCLEARRREVAALARSFAAADGQVVDNAVVATGRIAGIDACKNTKALAAPVPMPADPAVRASIDDLDRRAAEAKVLWITGKAADGLRVARAAEADARAVGYFPVLAKLLVVKGNLEDASWAFDDAEATYNDAATTAVRAHDDGAAADAWMWLSSVTGFRLRRAADGARWARYAEAAIERLGGDDERELMLLGRVFVRQLFTEKKLEDALATAEREAAMCERIHCSEEQSAAVDAARADVLNEMERSADALPLHEKVLAVYSRLYGSLHPQSLIAGMNMADDLSDIDRVDEAIAAFRALPSVPRDNGWRHHRLAAALRKKRDFSTALEEDRQALAALAALGIAEGADHAYALAGEGADLIGLGRAKEAIAPLERAETLRSKDPPTSLRAESRLDLSRALWDGGSAADRPRARSVAADARADALPQATRYGGSSKRTLDAIDAWLAAH